jgi:two-component system LytT family sensor kinase
MSAPRPTNSRSSLPWRRWATLAGLTCALFTAVALLATGQSYFLIVYMSDGKDQAVDLQGLLVRNFIIWNMWALATPLLVWFARRFPLDGRRRLRHLLLQVGFSFLVSVGEVALDVPVLLLIPLREMSTKSPVQLFQLVFFSEILGYLLVCGAVLGVSQATAYYRKYRERELQASQLASQLAEAHLQVLKMQLQPHFLFNTLHAISALMHQDVELADRMLARLGELLRSTLEHAGTQEVALRDELDFIHPYLEIEQARLGPRLSVAIDVEAAALDAQVPNLLLQPLVENAIRHGIAPRSGPGRIEIWARRENGHLQLRVRDNGRGLAANYTEGVGVGNTRARLRQLYGSDHDFTLSNRQGGGLEVVVAVPFRSHG